MCEIHLLKDLSMRLCVVYNSVQISATVSLGGPHPKYQILHLHIARAIQNSHKNVFLGYIGRTWISCGCDNFNCSRNNLWTRRSLVGNVLNYYTLSQGSSSMPAIKTKYKKYFFGDFLSAQDFLWQKLWE